MYDENNNLNGENVENPTPEEKINEEAEKIEKAYEDVFSGEPAAEETAAEQSGEGEEPVYTSFTSERESAEPAEPEEPAQPEAQGYYGQSANPADEQESVDAQRIPNNGYSYGYRQQAGGYGAGAPQSGYGAGYNPNGAPQGGYPYGSGGYQRTGYYQAPPQAPAPKKKTGKKVFFAIVAVLLVFAIIASTAAVTKSVVTKKSGESGESFTYSQSGEVEKKDDTSLKIDETPSSGSSKSGKNLSTDEIAEKGRASNVGVLIYSSQTSSSVSGQGSGIVMGLDGTGKYTYIITCAHVVSDSGISIKVQKEDGESYEAELVGYDQKTDVGVIKVQSTDFTAAEFGDSDALRVGDPVYAVGNPGGVEFFGSFTAGMISAINRPVNSEIGYTMTCIQHDAAINPGNSGGMLLNKYGQVVGINSQKIVKTDYEGMSFAIPISSAKVIIDDLIQYGYVKDRAKISINYAPVSASTQYYMIAQVNNLPQGTLIITQINSDSSLNQTDARVYDLIIAVDGTPLDTANTLLEKVEKGKVGQKMTLTLCRVNSNYTVDQFDVEITLIEDRGNSRSSDSAESTTRAPSIYDNPFDYFFGY